MRNDLITERERLTRDRNAQWYKNINYMVFQNQLNQYLKQISECKRRNNVSDMMSGTMEEDMQKCFKELEILAANDPMRSINHDINEPEWMKFLTEAERSRLRIKAILHGGHKILGHTLIQLLGKIGAVVIIAPSYLLYYCNILPAILVPLPTIGILWSTHIENREYEEMTQKRTNQYMEFSIEYILKHEYLYDCENVHARAKHHEKAFLKKEKKLLEASEAFRMIE
jgi:hypothetical protein